MNDMRSARNCIVWKNSKAKGKFQNNRNNLIAGGVSDSGQAVTTEQKRL